VLFGREQAATFGDTLVKFYENYTKDKLSIVGMLIQHPCDQSGGADVFLDSGRMEVEP